MEQSLWVLFVGLVWEGLLVCLLVRSVGRLDCENEQLLRRLEYATGVIEGQQKTVVRLRRRNDRQAERLGRYARGEL